MRTDLQAQSWSGRACPQTFHEDHPLPLCVLSPYVTVVMCPLVHFQVVRLPEALPALRAHVRPLGRVRSLVPLEAVGAEEALVALTAGVRPRPRVVAQVDGQVARLREALPAVRALEGLVARVESLVLQQLGVREEALAAVGAQVRPLARVGQLVPDQRGLVDEALVALRAAEDVLAGVAALVLLHVALPLEALAAVGAHEGHVLRVDLHVVQQAAPVQEALAALRAHVRPLLLVDALVRGKCRAVGEALAAAARVRPLLPVGLQVLVEVAGAAEGQLAAGALVGLRRLARVLAVGPQVSHQRRFPGKRPAALGAQVLAVLHVGAPVLPLRLQGLEGLAADQAPVLAAGLVSLLVSLQRLLEGEPASALGAEERLLTRVTPLMSFEQRLELEALLAVGTTERCLFVCRRLSRRLALQRVDAVDVLLDLCLVRAAEGALWASEGS